MEQISKAINKILLDRMDLIKVSKFDNAEKIVITRDYLLKDIFKKYGISRPMMKMLDDEFS